MRYTSVKPGILYTLALSAALVLALLAGWLPSTVRAQSEAVELILFQIPDTLPE